MLDAYVTLFNLQFGIMETLESKAMVVAGCNAYIGDSISKEDRVYSEWEENNYAYLNKNDYHGKVLELEICLHSISKYIYSEFYARCFAIRTDNGIRTKINGPQKSNWITKMNLHNQMVLGIGLFLSDYEYENLQKANMILIEGCFAIKKKNNTYGIAIQLKKKDSMYEVQFANTYKIKNIGSIDGLAH